MVCSRSEASRAKLSIGGRSGIYIEYLLVPGDSFTHFEVTHPHSPLTIEGDPATGGLEVPEDSGHTPAKICTAVRHGRAAVTIAQESLISQCEQIKDADIEPAGDINGRANGR